MKSGVSTTPLCCPGLSLVHLTFPCMAQSVFTCLALPHVSPFSLALHADEEGEADAGDAMDDGNEEGGAQRGI